MRTASLAVASVVLCWAAPPCAAQITGSISSTLYEVNGSPGLYFLGPGDFLRATTHTSVSVGAASPATAFSHYTAITGTVGAPVYNDAGTGGTVQPSNTDGWPLSVGHLVMDPNPSQYYEAWTSLRYWDSTIMNYVILDTDWAQFYTD
jgi:hypothetical protein